MVLILGRKQSPLLQLKPGVLPRPPVEIADEVEMYAREYGRHAKLFFVPTMFANGQILRGSWVVRFTLRPDDKRMILWQEQRTEEEPTEEVWIQEENPNVGKFVPNGYGIREPGYRPLDILQMGASGVREFLEKGNMWSGRIGVDSPEEQLKLGREARDEHREKNRKAARDHAGKTAVERRRSILGIPYVGVIEDVVKTVSTLVPKRAAKKPRKEK